MDAHLKQQLMDLEVKLLQPDIRKSVKQLNTLLADDFLEFGQSGKTYSKQDVLEALPELTEELFMASHFEARMLSDDVVLLTYLLERRGNDAMKSRSCRSSIWKRTGEQWQMTFHQGTPRE